MPESIELTVHRRAIVPDPIRIERCARAPEFGPRIAFLSGGSALKDLSRTLKHFTHNSVHLITPFDSGGSSAVLRQAFHILGVGDLRNRLMALADETDLGSPEVSALFSHRFAKSEELLLLLRELDSMVEGEHPLVRAIPSGLRQIIRIHLRKFVQKMPAGFDLRGASIGNLVLVGGYLVNQRDIDSVLYLFSRLVSVRGTVRPTSHANAQLLARHESGECTAGQHELGRTPSLDRGPIDDLFLTSDLEGHEPVAVEADPNSLQLLRGADLLCLPMGSFFGSLLANLLPAKIGQTISELSCLKVYVPNSGVDPEMRGLTLSTAVEKILNLVRRDAGHEVPTDRILDYVLLDSRNASYSFELDLERLTHLGVGVIDIPLIRTDPERLDPQLLAQALLSLA